VTNVARARRLPLLTADLSDHPRWLLGVPHDQDAAACARELARGVVQAWPGPAPITVGVSRPTVVLRLAAGFREAEECLRFARVSQTTGVVEHANLGLHLLLASLLDGPQLAAFVEAELGPLLDHDAKARSPLLPTLRALLRNDSNRAEAARELHLERRSVYYRIERIEEVLGFELDDHDTKLALGVALRALQLIEDRSVMRGAGRGL
jgi:PucR family transcriptional regulator, purine catabolism regulatory protein